MTPALDLKNLTQRLGTTVLFQNLNLQLNQGEHRSILGRSGVGKTTLLRLIAGLLPPTSGTILLQGNLASETGKVVLAPQHRGVQMVFQDLGLWPGRTAQQQLADVFRSGGDKRTTATQKAQQFMEHLGLQACMDRIPAQLSGGEGKRISFARALAAQPKLLLLDEPFAGLDPEARSRCLDLLRLALNDCATSLLVVSHDPQDGQDLDAPVQELTDQGLGVWVP